MHVKIKDIKITWNMTIKESLYKNMMLYIYIYIYIYIVWIIEDFSKYYNL